MGRDIHINILIKTRNEGWKDVVLYKPDKKGSFIPIDIYPYRNYELFDILYKNTDAFFPATLVKMNELPQQLKTQLEKEQNDYGFYGFFEANLADIKLYYIDNPIVENYDKNDGSIKDHPIKDFLDTICNYVNICADGFMNFFYSDIKIIYRFDC